MAEVSVQQPLPPHLRKHIRNEQRQNISSASASQTSKRTKRSEMKPTRVTTNEIKPDPHDNRRHPEPSESARKQYLSTTRAGVDLDMEAATSKPAVVASRNGLNEPTTSENARKKYLSTARTGTDVETQNAASEVANVLFRTVLDDLDEGVPLSEFINRGSEPKPTNPSAKNVVNNGESSKSTLLSSGSEKSAHKSRTPNKGGAKHLPLHLRWLEEAKAKSDKVQVSGNSAPTASQSASPAKATAERESPPDWTVEESSRLKEQARLESRTGVAKTKGSRGKEVAVVKYEGYDPKNATLAAAKKEKPFPCAIIDCPAGFGTEKELHKHQDQRHTYCRKCKLWFDDGYMFHIHKVESEEHVVCQTCSVDFYTVEALETHMKQFHAMQQNIPCYGCGKSFVRGAGIVDHVEKGLCQAITPYKLHLSRAEKTADFIAGKHRIPSGPADADPIESEDEEPKTQRPKAYQHILDDDKGQPAEGTFRSLAPEHAVRTTTPSSSRGYANPKEWPVLGNEVVLAGSATSTQGTEASRPVRKPIAAGAKFPPEARRVDRPNNLASLLEVPLEERCTYKNASGEILFDPYDPTSNGARFKNYDGKYSCYVAMCGKSFTTELGFRAHLRSEVHHGLQYACSACLKTFGSATALTAHLESASTRCSVKQSVDYSSTVGMASGGLVNVKAFDVSGNVIFSGASEEDKKNTLQLESKHNTRW